MNFYHLEYEATLEDVQKFHYPNQKIGVIAYIEDDQGKILLQKRGAKSRDDNGLYEAIGGGFDNADIDFRSAIIREIQEEAGTEMNFSLEKCVGIYHCCKKDINWIFVVYYAKYLNGEIKIMEPEKCTNYQFFDYENSVQSALVSETCRVLIQNVKKYI